MIDPEKALQAVAELENIACAKRFDRDIFADDTAFSDWAQSRARFALENIRKGVTFERPGEG